MENPEKIGGMNQNESVISYSLIFNADISYNYLHQLC